jgi:hypothetical protein
MDYVIEILRREQLNTRHDIRRLRQLSDELQCDVVKDLPKREAELQQAITHLQSCGTHAAANNSDYTAALRAELLHYQVSRCCSIGQICAHELATRLNSVVKAQQNCA